MPSSLSGFIIQQREQAQEDIISILEGLEQVYVDRVCQVVVDRFNFILIKEKTNEAS